MINLYYVQYITIYILSLWPWWAKWNEMLIKTLPCVCHCHAPFSLPCCGARWRLWLTSQVETKIDCMRIIHEVDKIIIFSGYTVIVLVITWYIQHFVSKSSYNKYHIEPSMWWWFSCSLIKTKVGKEHTAVWWSNSQPQHTHPPLYTGNRGSILQDSFLKNTCANVWFHLILFIIITRIKQLK